LCDSLAKNVDLATAWLLYAAPDFLDSSHGLLELMKLSDVLTWDVRKVGRHLTLVNQMRLLIN
jgi:hypothetical protein